MLPSAGMNPRQMAAMMKRLGIEVQEIDAEEVIVRAQGKEYRFRKPSVSVMRAQGVETWQISGQPQVTARQTGGANAPEVRPAAGGAAGKAPAARAPAAATAQDGGGDADASPAAAYEPTEDDIAVVAGQTGRSADEARRALAATGGDLAQAILRLGEAA